MECPFPGWHSFIISPFLNLDLNQIHRPHNENKMFFYRVYITLHYIEMIPATRRAFYGVASNAATRQVGGRLGTL